MKLNRRQLLGGVAGAGFVPLAGYGAAGAEADRTARSVTERPATAASSPDAVPTLHWQWTDGGSDGVVIQDVVVTSDGGVVCVGFESNSNGSQDVLVRKLDRDGEERWAERIGGEGHDAAIGVTESESGDLLFCGGSVSAGSESMDAVVGRIDSGGDLAWYEAIGRNGTNDAVHAVTQGEDGGYVVGGGTQYVGGASGDGVGRLCKVTESGTVEWDETYDDDHAGEIHDVVATDDGGYAFVGTRASSDGVDGRAWLGVVAEDGTLEWSRTYGGAGSRIGYSLIETDGGYAFAGTTTPPARAEPTAWVVTVDDRGDLEWERTYGSGNADLALSIAAGPGGGYSLAGWTDDGSADGGWLLQLDSVGDLVWEETVGGASARFNSHARIGDSYAVGGYSGGSGTASALVLGLGPHFDEFDGRIGHTRSTTSRPTMPLSPVTIQVTEHPRNAPSYSWEVIDAPENSDPGLLLPEGRSHTTLHPDEPGAYTVQVTVEDDGGDTVDTGTVTIDVESRNVDDVLDIDAEMTVSELAERYAPNLHFHEKEQFFPTRYEAFVENAELRVDGTGTVVDAPSLLDLGTSDRYRDYSVADSDAATIHVPRSEDELEARQSDYPRTVHASVTETEVTGDGPVDNGKYVALTYWFFYLFDPKKYPDAESELEKFANDPPGQIKKYGFAHPTDTESVTILLDDSGPQWVGAAQHYNGEYLRWEKVAGTDGPATIDIYPAVGAHSSFLVDTSLYPGDIPGQLRWLGKGVDELDTTSTLQVLEGLTDVTSSGTEWTYDGTDASKDYDIVVLTDEEPWTDFEGSFDADAGMIDGGSFPMKDDRRWNDTGEWMTDRMIPEPDVLNDGFFNDNYVPLELDAFFTLDSVTGAPSAFKVRNFVNPGKKPHTFIVDATIDASESAGVERVTRTKPLGWDEFETIEISLDDRELPSDGDVTVSVDVRTYPSDVATDDDRVLQRDGTTSLTSIVSDISFERPSLLGSLSDPVAPSTTAAAGIGSAETVVAPGESAETTTTVENSGSETHEFRVTLVAEGPKGEIYSDGADGTVVELAPGESRSVDLSWTVGPNVPEGSYDLLMEAWLETDSDERRTRLASKSTSDRVTVEKPDGELTVDSTPADATILVDGEPIGTTPVTTDLPVGTHPVVALRDGYETLEEPIEIDAEETTTHTFDLTPLDSTANDDGQPEDDADDGASTDDGSTPAPATQSVTESDFPVSPPALAGMGAVSAGMLYLAARMLSDRND